jgi:hypothetical protein
LGAKKRENIVEKAQKTTKPCDFRLKQRFFGLNSYSSGPTFFLLGVTYAKYWSEEIGAIGGRGAKGFGPGIGYAWGGAADGFGIGFDGEIDRGDGAVGGRVARGDLSLAET